jgi:hypothetical protein
MIKYEQNTANNSLAKIVPSIHGIFHGIPWNYETKVDGIPWNSMEFRQLTEFDGIRF